MSYWILLYPVSVAMSIFARLISPILAMCVYKKYRLDVVKRYGKKQVGFDRYYLWKCLNWFATFDNAQDEYYWGVYGDSDKVSVEQYDKSIWLRYWYRLAWLNRNAAYGFSQTVLGAEPPAWQYKKYVNIGFGWYLDVNIGFKSHKGFTRLMYASRWLAPRKYNLKDK